MKGYLFFTTVSGDRYMIQEHKYEEEIKSYYKACKEQNEEAMLTFEEGVTGWLYAPVGINLS